MGASTGIKFKEKPVQSEDMNKNLIVAIRDNDLFGARRAISKGANPNLSIPLKDREGEAYATSPLVLAIEKGNVEIVREMAKAKADVNFKYDMGITALMVASASGNTKMVDELLRAGASLNATDENGTNSLMWAAFKNQRDTSKQLIEKGISVYSTDNYGMTPLAMASSGGNLEACMVLLSYTAPKGEKIEGESLIAIQKSYIDMADSYGRTALIYAAENGQITLVRYLLKKGADPNIKDSYGETALMDAAYNGNKEVCKLLIKNGADVKATDSAGNDALAFSMAKPGNESTVNLIIDSIKPEISKYPKQKKNALLLESAAYGKNLDFVKFLMENGADADYADNGISALGCAVSNGSAEMAELILKNSKDRQTLVNSKDSNGLTPLMYASAKGNKEMVSLLIQNGADIYAKDGNEAGLVQFNYDQKKKTEENASSLLRNNDDIYIKSKNRKGWSRLRHGSAQEMEKNVTSLLQKKEGIYVKAEGLTPLMYAASAGRGEICAILLQNAKDKEDYANIRDNFGSTALMHASSSNQFGAVQLLVSSKADVNVRDREFGMTALMRAAQKGNEGIVSFLIANKADVDARDKGGKTALMHAASNNQGPVAQTLILKKADLNARDDEGYNALMCAALNGSDVSLYKMLIDNGIDSKARNRQGNDAVSIASLSKHEDGLDFLRDPSEKNYAKAMMVSSPKLVSIVPTRKAPAEISASDIPALNKKPKWIDVAGK